VDTPESVGRRSTVAVALSVVVRAVGRLLRRGADRDIVYAVVGACSYLNSSDRRPTLDLDLTSLRHGLTV
jgi:hypothetical protein